MSTVAQGHMPTITSYRFATPVVSFCLLVTPCLAVLSVCIQSYSILLIIFTSSAMLAKKNNFQEYPRQEIYTHQKFRRVELEARFNIPRAASALNQQSPRPVSAVTTPGFSSHHARFQQSPRPVEGITFLKAKKPRVP